MKATLVWKGNMQFEAVGSSSGHKVILDAAPDMGGGNLGPRPMELLLHALGGCTGIDIVHTLRKMRLQVDRFEMTIEGTRAEDHPKRYTSIHIAYKLQGDLPAEKVRRAIKLSAEKYCSVAHSLNAGITYHFEINGRRFD